MKKAFSFVLVLLVITTSVCYAETFSIRNGIVYGDTMKDVESKESLGIAERTSDTLTTNTGTIASVDNSYIIYSFNSDGKLIDILMDFGVHIGKPEQAISAYETIYETLKKKYGTPYSIDSSDVWYVIYGSAVTKFASNRAFLKKYGLTPSLQGKVEWILQYDDINVKIDLIRYAPNGISATSISSDVIVSYRLFTNAEEQNAIDALNQKKQSYQDDL